MTVEVIAPGRVNIIGEHTDYNDGFVLPFAINKYVHVRISKSSKNWEIYSEKFRDTITLEKPGKTYTWADYVVGVVKILNEKFEIPPLRIEVRSDVPVGAGFSSSAALELAVAWGMRELLNLPVTKKEMVHLCHRAENEFVGTRCGVMDQFSVAFSRKGFALFLDTATLEYEYVPLNLNGARFYVIDTGVRRSLRSSEYNRRREECEEILRILSKGSFREVFMSELEQLPDALRKRARHVLEENERVLQTVEALREGNVEKLGELLYASHRSLRDLYEVSCREADYIVGWLERRSTVLGARIFGGGFGGGILVLSSTPLEELFTDLMKDYLARFKVAPQLLQVDSADGVKRI